MSGKACRSWSDAVFCGIWYTSLHCLLMLFNWLIDLRFHGLVNPLRSCQISPLSGYSSLETDTFPSWISGKERMTIEKFHEQSSWKNVAGPCRDRTHDLLITSQTCIRLTHQGWHRPVYQILRMNMVTEDFLRISIWWYFWHKFSYFAIKKVHGIHHNPFITLLLGSIA